MITRGNRIGHSTYLIKLVFCVRGVEISGGASSLIGLSAIGFSCSSTAPRTVAAARQLLSSLRPVALAPHRQQSEQQRADVWRRSDICVRQLERGDLWRPVYTLAGSWHRHLLLSLFLLTGCEGDNGRRRQWQARRCRWDIQRVCRVVRHKLLQTRFDANYQHPGIVARGCSPSLPGPQRCSHRTIQVQQLLHGCLCTLPIYFITSHQL